MKKTKLQKQVSSYIKSINEIQKHVFDSRLHFSTKHKDGLWYVIRDYKDGTKQVLDPKSEEEILPFVKEFWKKYSI